MKTKHKRNSELANKRKDELKWKRPTKAETVFWDFLKKYDIPAKFQRIFYMGDTFYIVDFEVLMKPRLLIELDGSVHNGRENYDDYRQNKLMGRKHFKRWQYSFLRFKNEEVFNGKAFQVMKELYPSKF